MPRQWVTTSPVVSPTDAKARALVLADQVEAMDVDEFPGRTPDVRALRKGLSLWVINEGVKKCRINRLRITGRMVHKALGLGERAAQRHLKALSDWGYFFQWIRGWTRLRVGERVPALENVLLDELEMAEVSSEVSSEVSCEVSSEVSPYYMNKNRNHESIHACEEGSLEHYIQEIGDSTITVTNPVDRQRYPLTAHQAWLYFERGLTPLDAWLASEEPPLSAEMPAPPVHGSDIDPSLADLQRVGASLTEAQRVDLEALVSQGKTPLEILTEVRSWPKEVAGGSLHG